MIVTFYTKEHCPLCDKGYREVETFAKEYELSIRKVDIYSDDTLLEKFHLMIPVVYYESHELGFGQLSADELEESFKQIEKEK
ncbi:MULTISPECIES: glutaredoxin family protein [Shouchella]|uniref:Glutaredoxin family protein n=2 Tax=Shouchella TaxID=2893057 RepID=A0ABY7W7J8_9BACI|nr:MULTISPECIES: glutaredoxin family protein [Shouchella]MED4129079.1 glutaredoxin family protein [Shouchella miscanthi]WDF04404.1 glutaredoxin family protein [Shouchella hunanensis]GAF21715.1 glutaredoxin family protein [Bacillus sp. JCM 19047]